MGDRYVWINDVEVRREFEEVREGDKFKLLASSGELLGIFIANKDPYLNEDGVWTIDCNEISGVDVSEETDLDKLSYTMGRGDD